MSLLEKALRKGNYELAAKTIVSGMLKVIHDRKEAESTDIVVPLGIKALIR